MCYNIDADFILANYFLHSSDPLTYDKLREIRKAIREQLQVVASIDISRSSLLNIVDTYPQFFKFSDHKFELVGGGLNKGYVERYFSAEVDDAIREKAIKAIVSV